jgi:thiaminase/transcriptional activator TenA
MGFVQEQLERLRPTWELMLRHPFLLQTRDGTIPFDTFATWMRQDYLFVEAAVPFIALMVPKAPPSHWELHTNVMAMFHKELGLFRERAVAAGVNMDDLRPSFTNHAYIQFLIATASQRSYAEIYTVLYAAEKAYHDSWTVVKKGIDPASVWYPFVENWAGEAFAGYVQHLEQELNALAEGAGQDERARMAELFETTLRYEIAFWDMAATSEGWPGLEAAALATAGGK